MWGVSNFAGVKNAEKLNYNRHLNLSNQPGSKFSISILLFLSVEFKQMTASASHAYLLFCSRRFQPSCPEAAMPFTSIHHTLVWLEWLRTALLKGEMVIKSDITCAPVSLKSKFPFLHWSRKLRLCFSFILLNFAISPKFSCWLLLGRSSSFFFLTFPHLPCLS